MVDASDLVSDDEVSIPCHASCPLHDLLLLLSSQIVMAVFPFRAFHPTLICLCDGENEVLTSHPLLSCLSPTFCPYVCPYPGLWLSLMSTWVWLTSICLLFFLEPLLKQLPSGFVSLMDGAADLPRNYLPILTLRFTPYSLYSLFWQRMNNADKQVWRRHIITNLCRSSFAMAATNHSYLCRLSWIGPMPQENGIINEIINTMPSIVCHQPLQNAMLHT
jgi:hypothetical protein